jgi:acyl transferase domain-containing protein/acyl carrier protein
MSKASESFTHLSPLKQAFLKLEEMQTKLEAMERKQTEPIAIIGMACRFPGGANDPESFWQLLRDGVDAIQEVPSDRWDLNTYYDSNPETPGKIYTRRGGFLEGVDEFDASFFGLAPREAAIADPQQRLLLEVSWEALENAGQAPDKLTGSSSGVFVGINSDDYKQLQLMSGDTTNFNAYTFTGNTSSVAAGRLSYFLGFSGPTLAVDTACSSSLVAVHLACQSLRAGECRLALAGGVNLMLSENLNIVLCRMRALSPDGYCKTFDAEANGYGRGEGCAVVVLKRLSDAVADGDNILALIRGTAINHDGKSSGLTVPNGLAQQKLISAALANAKVEPAQVSYVEVHGTGTALGDPIEVDALAAVLGKGRSHTQPLTLGSVKTNIGHLEAAAGVAGLIKVVLAMQHGEIPPHLHLKKLNPAISWEDFPLVIPTALTPWSSTEGQRRLAGVSSFGMSGTNAHVVLEEAPVASQKSNSLERPLHLLALSAKSEAALKELAGRFERYLATQYCLDKTDLTPPTPLPYEGRGEPDSPLLRGEGLGERLTQQYRLATHPSEFLGDVCFTANTGRLHFVHRLTLVANSPVQACQQLAAFASGKKPEGLMSGLVPRTGQPKVAFLFTGEGSQYVGMGRQLYETQPVFRQALERCDELLRSYLEVPLLEVLYPFPEGEHLQSKIQNPKSKIDETAYTQPALFALEYALAQLLLSWGIEPAVVMGHSVGEYVAACIAGVFSLEDGLKLIAQRGRLMQTLPPGGEMAAVKVFEQTALKVKYSSPKISLISNLTGALVTGKEVACAEYWCRHIREVVNFSESMQVLHKQGYELFVEIGPNPVLLGMGRKCFPEGTGVWLPSLQKGYSDWQQLLQSLGELYVRGVEVDWCGFDRNYSRRRLQLPTYPFERSRYWIDRKSETSSQKPETELSSSTDDWLYEVEWQHKPRANSVAIEPKQQGSWLIFGDRNSGISSAVATLLEERGETCVMVFPGVTYEISAIGHVQINPAQPEDFQRLLREVIGSDRPPCRGVVHLWSLESTPIEETTVDSLEKDQARNCGSILHLVQALSSAKVSQLPRLWLVTQGVQSIETDSIAVAQAPIWGLGRVIALEHPEMLGGLVDLASASSEEEAAAMLLEELWQPEVEYQISWRDGKRFVARLVRTESQKPLKTYDINQEPKIQNLKSDSTYLITGGLGGLGLKVAQWLADQGARNLVLVGRSGASRHSAKQLSKLKQAGVQVVIAEADISQEAEVRNVLAEIAVSQPPLRGIIHLAGVLDDGVLLNQDWQRFAKVMAPKVAGAWNLHSQTQDMPLDFFVNFSSAASLHGSLGQGSYAAGNAFLDALAHYRQLRGLPALTINWSSWDEVGMAAAMSSRDQQRWKAAGVSFIPVQQGLQLLGQLLGQVSPQIAVLPIDCSKFIKLFPSTVESSLLLEIVRKNQLNTAVELAVESQQNQILKCLDETPSNQRKDVLITQIQKDVAAVSGFEPSRLPDAQVGFFEMGMDSLMTLEFKNRLQSSLGISLASTLTFEYPTIEALADYLMTEVLFLEATAKSDAEFQKDGEERDSLLAEIKQLSEDELVALIDEELKTLVNH